MEKDGLPKADLAHTVVLILPLDEGGIVCTHPYCQGPRLKPYAYQDGLTKHVSRIHKNTTVAFKCRFCDHEGENKKRVMIHVATHAEGGKKQGKAKTSAPSKPSSKASPPTSVKRGVSSASLRPPTSLSQPKGPSATSAVMSTVSPPPTINTSTMPPVRRPPSRQPTQPTGIVTRSRSKSASNDTTANTTAAPSSTQIQKDPDLLENVPDPLPIIPECEFDGFEVPLQVALDPPPLSPMPPPRRSSDGNVPSVSPPRVDSPGNEPEASIDYVERFKACSTGRELEASMDALMAQVSEQLATTGTAAHHVPRPPPSGGKKHGRYDPVAATKIQRLYRRNRKRAFRNIVEGDSQHCQLPVDEVQRHFTAVFDANPRDEAPPPDCVPPWDPLADPEDSDPLSAPITIEEVTARLTKSMDTSPGPDGVRYSIWKKFPNGTHILKELYNAVLRLRYKPSSWSTSTTILLHKKDDVNDVTNWRPIALSNTAGKLFASIQGSRLLNWSRRNGRISKCQKGFMPYEGCLEHNAALQDMIQNARRTNTEAVFAWLDLRNAFGSAPHTTIFQGLALAGLAEDSISVVKLLYSDCTTSVRCGNSMTDPIAIKAGVKQGCPLSPVVFNLALEPLIRAVESLNQGIQIHGQSRSVLGYADDLVLISSSAEGLEEQLRVASVVAEWAGLSFNAKKCASLHVKGTKPGVVKTQFNIQAAPMEAIGANGVYQHLGVPTGYKVQPSALKTIEKMHEQLESIHKSLLAPWQKFDALHSFVLSQLSFHLKAGHVPKKPLIKLDKAIVRTCKVWLNLPERASNEILYLPYSLGGQNLLPLSQLADACQLTRAVRLLTSNDPSSAELAQKTMAAVASKRLRAEASQEDTARFYNGDASTEFKTYTDVESAWTHLRMATTRLKKSIDVAWKPLDSGLQLEICGQSAARNTVERQLRDALRLKYYNTLVAKKDQGKVFEVTAAVSASNHFCRAGKYTMFADWRFIHRARLNVVPLNGCNRSAKGNNNACRRCGQPGETLPHVLNHCRPLLHLGTQRHNAVLKRLQKAVKLGPDVTEYENTSIPGVASNLRPDWVTIDEKAKVVNIIDVTIPFESRAPSFTTARETKLKKYADIAKHFKDRGYDTFLDAFIIGPLGGYDPANNAVTKRLGINDNYLGLMRKLMVSDTIRWSREIYVQHVTGVNQQQKQRRNRQPAQ